MTVAESFQLVPIRTEPRPLADLNGRPLLVPGTTGNVVVGANVPPSGSLDAILLHWMDEDLFTGWVTHARQQLTSAIQNRDPVAMQHAAKAWVSALNALNIPWVIDPRSRMLHQEFIAGAPGGSEPDHLSAEYRAHYRYNDTLWLAPDPLRCIVAASEKWVAGSSGQTFGGCNSDNPTGAGAFPRGMPLFTGIIPAQARDAFNRLAPGAASNVRIQFLPRLQFVVRVPDNQSNFAPDGTASGQYLSANDPHVPLPFDIGIMKAPTVYNDVLWKTEPKQYYKHSDGSDASNDKDGWDTWAFDNNGNAPQQIRPSYAVYAVYLSALISQLEGRTARQIVQDARAYAIYRNMQAIGASGGSLQGLAGSQIQNISDITTPGGAIATTLHAVSLIVAAAATAVGAAFGGVGAGVGALIGGAVAGISAVASNLLPPDLHNVYIDDLERPKPWLERSWLSGDPSSQDNPPILNLGAPIGWTRPRNIGAYILRAKKSTPKALVQAAIANAQRRQAQLDAQKPTVPPTFWWILGGLAFGGAITYAASRMTRGSRNRVSSKTRSRSTRRTRKS